MWRGSPAIRPPLPSPCLSSVARKSSIAKRTTTKREGKSPRRRSMRIWPFFRPGNDPVFPIAWILRGMPHNDLASRNLHTIYYYHRFTIRNHGLFSIMEQSLVCSLFFFIFANQSKALFQFLRCNKAKKYVYRILSGGLFTIQGGGPYF